MGSMLVGWLLVMGLDSCLHVFIRKHASFSEGDIHKLCPSQGIDCVDSGVFLVQWMCLCGSCGNPRSALI